MQNDFWTRPKKAIKRAYRRTDDEILETVVGSRGGSTAVTAILVDGEKLIVANVGDSCAILCRNGKAKQITVDHEPEKEKQQVESRGGGFVSQKPGEQIFLGIIEILSYRDLRVVSVDSRFSFLIYPKGMSRVWMDSL